VDDADAFEYELAMMPRPVGHYRPRLCHKCQLNYQESCGTI
jgi:hypothetical protein